jgi:hypothetical protein
MDLFTKESHKLEGGYEEPPVIPEVFSRPCIIQLSSVSKQPDANSAMGIRFATKRSHYLGHIRDYCLGLMPPEREISHSSLSRSRCMVL